MIVVQTKLKAQGVQKKKKLSKEEHTLLWAEMKQKLKSLRRKNKKYIILNKY